MASLSKINIRFNADLKQFSSQMQNASRRMTKLGKKFKSVGAGLSIGLTAPIVALGVKSVIAFDKQAKAIAQVEAGLKSTEGAAGKTSKELQDMASALQGNSLFGDEEILKDVTAQLLTFTNIAGRAFDRTQLAALDLATRLGGDLKSATIQLGKALNDPTKNLSALARSGIQFSDDQMKLIKSLQSTNRLAEAQTIILDELEKQYGGSAAAAAAAGLGPFKQLGNALGDLLEDFGKIISEGMTPLITKVKSVVESFKSLEDGTKRNIVKVGGLLAVLGPLLFTVGFLGTTVIPGLVSAFVALRAAMISLSLIIAANPFGAIATAVGLLVVALIALTGSSEKAVKAQTTLQKISEKAQQSIAAERAQLVTLLAIARDELVSKEQRVKAIKDLNKLSPKYLGDLTLETIKTDAAREAIEKYNDALLKTAKVKAAQDALQKIQAKIIEAEIKNSKARTKAATDEAYLKRQEAIAIKKGISLQDQLSLSNAFFGKIQANKLKLLNDEAAIILEIIKNNDTFVGSIKTTTTALEAQTEAMKKAAAARGERHLEIPAMAVDFSEGVDGGKLEGFLVTLDKVKIKSREIARVMSEEIGPAIKDAAAQIIVGMGEVIAGLALGTAGAADVANLMLTVLGDLMIRLGKVAIQTAVGLLAINLAFASLNPAVALAAGVALVAFGSLIKGAVKSSPGEVRLAQGGVAFGETLATIGDNRNAAFDPEVVSPLSKLKDYMSPDGGGQSVNITLDGILRGQDLELMISRVIEKKSRRV
tara:strand:+ start:11312 stop:13606 length:2295 start_codon:yes stop_codon:yes gene_type:complete